MADGDITGTIALTPAVAAELEASAVTQGTVALLPSISSVMTTSAAVEGAVVLSPAVAGGLMEGFLIYGGVTLAPDVSADVTGIIDSELSLTMAALTMELQGAIAEQGLLDVALPNVGIDFEGMVNEQGELALVLPSMSLSATGVMDEQGRLDLGLPRLILALDGQPDPIGEFEWILPGVTLELSGVVSELGTLALTMPGLELFLECPPSLYLTMVMNLRNRALTEYDNYPFNSMCRFQGHHLATDGAGIFDLDGGDRDDGEQIDWHFRTGYLDQERKTKKRLRQAWVSLKTDGTLIVSVVQPDGAVWSYTAETYEQTETGIRIKVGKGLRSKYVALDFASVEGSSLELDAIRLHLDEFKVAR